LDRQPLQAPHRLLGFSAYEWLVIAAGWAGWGFDVFDAVFNFVRAPLHPDASAPAARFSAAHAAVVVLTGR
jgi:hypothetical protein